MAYCTREAREQVGIFADTLYEPNDIVETRCLKDGSAEKQWCKAAELPDHLDKLIRLNRAGWNVYAGVNPRDGHGKSGDASVKLARNLFNEFDPKHFDLPDDGQVPVDAALARIERAGLPEPTLGLWAGRGPHFYWGLTEPLTDMVVWRMCQKRIITVLNSDAAIHNPERIMRLPGYVNHKNGQEARILFARHDRRYDLTALMARVPELPKTAPVAVNVPVTLRPVDADIVAIPMNERARRFALYAPHCEPAISGKGGHNALYRFIAKGLIDFALDVDTLRPFLDEYNARCVPPWSAGELQHKLDDVDKLDTPRGAKLLERQENAAASSVPRAFNDPERLAAEFVAANVPYRHWQAEFFQWTGRHWMRQSDDEMDAVLRRHCVGAFETYWRGAETDRIQRLAELRRQFDADRAKSDKAVERAITKAEKPTPCPAVSRNTVDEVAAALKSCAIIPNSVVDGTHLPDGTTPNWLAMRNGVLDLNTGKLRAHDPAFFNLSSLPYDFDPQATCPEFTAAVERIFRDDPSKVLLLQETFGYCLCPGQEFQRFFIWLGLGGNGKGVMSSVLTAMIGKENVGNLSLKAFSNEYAAISLVGKKLNVGSEIRDDPQVAEDVLKQITGGDTLAMNRKGKPWITAKINAKLLFLVNELPKFVDKSNGLWDRFLPLHFTVSFRDSDDRVLGMEKEGYWTAELPGILNWALAGRARLLENKRFTLPKSSTALVEEHRLASNPVALFTHERIDTQPDSESAWIGKDELYGRFRVWYAENHPSGKVMSKDTFCREFMRHTKCEDGRYRAQGGRVYAFLGIRYKYGPDAGAAEPEPTPDSALLDTVLTNGAGAPF